MSEEHDAKAEAAEREYRSEKTTEEAVKQAKIDLLTDCLEVAHQEEGPSSKVYERIKDRLEDAKAGRELYSSYVAALEERFAEDQEDATLRRDLHLARVKAGWVEFRIDAVSGVDPRTVIPWVATREVKWAEAWDAKAYGSEVPQKWWLEPEAKAIEGGHFRVYRNPKVCDDGKWRRDVIQQIDVVAIEDLAHLRSITERMEDLILYKPDETGLPRISIFDQASS